MPGWRAYLPFWAEGSVMHSGESAVTGEDRQPSGDVKCAMPYLHAYVVYAGDLHGWEPAGLDLVDYAQDNPMLDAQRESLAAEFPRRAFGTDLRVTVGGLRADAGTRYTGRDRPAGLAKLADLQRTRKLGVIEGGHLLTKTFDRDDHSRDESISVSVEARFTRPQLPEANATSSVIVQMRGSLGERFLDALVAATWETFCHLVEVAPVATAVATWDAQSEDYRHAPAGEPPVAAFMHFGPDVVARLGGAAAAAKALDALEWKPLRGDEANGVVMQLGRRPEHTTGERLATIRNHLRPVT